MFSNLAYSELPKKQACLLSFFGFFFNHTFNFSCNKWEEFPPYSHFSCNEWKNLPYILLYSGLLVYKGVQSIDKPYGVLKPVVFRAWVRNLKLRVPLVTYNELWGCQLVLRISNPQLPGTLGTRANTSPGIYSFVMDQSAGLGRVRLSILSWMALFRPLRLSLQ